MKEVRLFLALALCFACAPAAQAQPEASEHPFVKLESGRVEHGSVVTKDPFLQKAYLLVDDSLRIGLDSVSTFRTEKGYFALTPEGKPMRRVEVGRLDLYRRHEWRSTPTVSPPGMGGGLGMFMTRETFGYFTETGSDSLREVNHDNLREAVAGHRQATSHLDTYNRMAFAQWGLVGGALVAAGITAASAGDDGLPALGIGATVGLAAGANILHLVRPNQLDEAVRAYNDPIAESSNDASEERRDSSSSAR